MANFEDKKSSNDVINNDTISDDEVVASYVPPRYLFTFPNSGLFFSWGKMLCISGSAIMLLIKTGFGINRYISL